MNADTNFRFDPCLPSLALVPPRGEGWSHEIKWDGYRAGVVIDGGVRVLSRRGNDMTAKVPEIVEAARRLEVRSAVLDGEAVVLDDAGISRLSLLRAALGHGGAGIVLVVFDLLELDGVDLRPEPLSVRRERLSQVLGRAPSSALRLSESFDAPAAEIYANACRLGLEGIVSKRCAAPYRGGRQRTWIKLKCWEEVECVVVGFEPPAGRTSGVGSLLLGEERDGSITYLGRVGAGLTATLGRRLAMRWRPSSEPACALPADRRRHPRWVVPEVSVRVRRLQGEDLRHASLLGLVPSLPTRAE